MFEIPLQIIDDFLRSYTVGHALLLVFLLAVVGGFAVNRSMKVLGLQLSLFGVLFVLTPSTTMPVWMLYLGVGLAVVGPVVFVAAED
ncbi:hypothetical protein HWV07_18085 [Natronomonas salina]|uniref:hypothetical protein n=1 Tax=Natronomonas salina TaxID=1710540 RepID=UPI0015B672C2|nr:hypothetical protein [Natronomonas salina]QLD90847.1 hypothetical protein HWV07_18085 [Natronomonas salina]